MQTVHLNGFQLFFFFERSGVQGLRYECTYDHRTTQNNRTLVITVINSFHLFSFGTYMLGLREKKFDKESLKAGFQFTFK